jgi:hypothetical protein
MNTVVRQLFDNYLQVTDHDKSAAASLTLADVMQSVKDDAKAGRTPAKRPAAPTDQMLNLRQAAQYLGYTTNCLRKIVSRSHRSHNGQSVHGPTIDFFQSSPKSTIFFRQEWLEQFIEKHHVQAGVPIRPSATNRRLSKHNCQGDSMARQWAAMAAQ